MTKPSDCEPTLQDDPSRELEAKLKRDPGNEDLQVDVGSDESMDASDPVSATRGGDGEPVPSSGFPEKD